MLAAHSSRFFEEVLPLFPDEMLHIGGDEVKLQCWYSNPAIASWMEANNFTGTVRPPPPPPLYLSFACFRSLTTCTAHDDGDEAVDIL
jgi:hypothetical protein